jgi:hypothetical protein
MKLDSLFINSESTMFEIKQHVLLIMNHQVNLFVASLDSPIPIEHVELGLNILTGELEHLRRTLVDAFPIPPLSAPGRCRVILAADSRVSHNQ